MRRIQKTAEPACLKEVRDHAAAHAPDTWDMKTCDQPIRDALCAEQFHLCAYCMNRIRPDGTKMKVEHFIARSDDAKRMYDWSNLLGVCLGRYQTPDGVAETCDTARRNRKLHINPADAEPDADRTYQADWKGGTVDVVARHPDVATKAKEDVQTLRLNEHEFLKENRKALIARLRQLLSKDDSDANLLNLYTRHALPMHGELPAFAPFGAGYQLKKLRQRGLQVPTPG